MNTFATLFSGGELAGVGLQMAGMRHLWGVEYDENIAAVAERNGFPLIVGDVRSVDYSALDRPDWLHMSPVCKNASVAKAGGGEDEEDIDTARACVRAILATRPDVVSLENVWGYRKFEAFALILRGLTAAGYYADYWHLNSADYGVPQARKRLIMIARRDGWPSKPRPTHHDPSKTDDAQLSLFAPSTAPWIGWYEAIEDLIPSLPDSEFAPWQLERLPVELLAPFIVEQNANATSGSPIYKESDRPVGVIRTRQEHVPRAFIAPGGNTFKPRTAHEPARTIGDTNRVGNLPRAFIMSEKDRNEWGKGYRTLLEPAPTMQASLLPQRLRAFIVSAAGTHVTTRQQTGRVPSVVGSEKTMPHRAAVAGRVVKMTPRALARFQSLPDWYALPERAALACTIIGNGVPCLLMQRVTESVRGAA